MRDRNENWYLLNNILAYYCRPQELSPTTDANLVNSLMNLFDCLIDPEFHDEAKISTMEDREIISWIEVSALDP